MALASPPSTPPASSNLTHIHSSDAPPTDFNVVAHYAGLIRNDPSLTPPIAAIESLIALLNHTNLTTVSETLAQLSNQSHVLQRGQLNPIPVSAGTDLFQKYLISAFQQRSSAHIDFSTLRAQLIQRSRVFLANAKNAPRSVATSCLHLIPDESTIFTYPNTQLASTTIQYAIDKGRYFTLINLTSSSTRSKPTPTPSIPTSTLSIQSFSSAIPSLSPTQQSSTILLISAHVVFSNGSLLAPLGTHLLAHFASSCAIPVYCAIESFKLVRAFPLSSSSAELRRLGIKQDVLRLEGGITGDESDEEDKMLRSDEDRVEIVPASLITARVTETGIMTPSAVSEELIKLWF